MDLQRKKQNLSSRSQIRHFFTASEQHEKKVISTQTSRIRSHPCGNDSRRTIWCQNSSSTCIGYDIALQATINCQTKIKNDIKQILNPYFTTKKNGTGLGLAIVNKIINDHNGELKFLTISNGAKVEIILKINGNRNSYS